MKGLLRTVSFCALAGSLAVALAFFADAISLEAAKSAFLWLAAAWFVSVPFWMEHRAS